MRPKLWLLFILMATLVVAASCALEEQEPNDTDQDPIVTDAGSNGGSNGGSDNGGNSGCDSLCECHPDDARCQPAPPPPPPPPPVPECGNHVCEAGESFPGCAHDCPPEDPAELMPIHPEPEGVTGTPAPLLVHGSRRFSLSKFYTSGTETMIGVQFWNPHGLQCLGGNWASIRSDGRAYFEIPPGTREGELLLTYFDPNGTAAHFGKKAAMEQMVDASSVHCWQFTPPSTWGAEDWGCDLRLLYTDGRLSTHGNGRWVDRDPNNNYW